MAIRDNQKMVVFTNKELVNALTKEEARKKNVNISNVIEENLLWAMLTKNENVREWLIALYIEEISMKRFMEAVWGLMATDSRKNMKVKENLEIVKIAKEMASGQKADTNNKMFKGKYYSGYLNSQLDSIANRCERLIVEAKETDDFLLQILRSDDITKNLTTTHYIQNVKRYYNTDYFEDVTKEIRKMIKNINQDTDNICLDEIYKIIIEAWEYIYEYSFTYKLLLELTKLQMHFDSKWRYDIRQALLFASSKWD